MIKELRLHTQGVLDMLGAMPAPPASVPQQTGDGCDFRALLKESHDAAVAPEPAPVAIAEAPSATEAAPVAAQAAPVAEGTAPPEAFSAAATAAKSPAAAPAQPADSQTPQAHDAVQLDAPLPSAAEIPDALLLDDLCPEPPPSDAEPGVIADAETLSDAAPSEEIPEDADAAFVVEISDDPLPTDDADEDLLDVIEVVDDDASEVECHTASDADLPAPDPLPVVPAEAAPIPVAVEANIPVATEAAPEIVIAEPETAPAPRPVRTVFAVEAEGAPRAPTPVAQSAAALETPEESDIPPSAAPMPEDAQPSESGETAATVERPAARDAASVAPARLAPRPPVAAPVEPTRDPAPAPKTSSAERPATVESAPQPLRAAQPVEAAAAAPTPRPTPEPARAAAPVAEVRPAAPPEADSDPDQKTADAEVSAPKLAATAEPSAPVKEAAAPVRESQDSARAANPTVASSAKTAAPEHRVESEPHRAAPDAPARDLFPKDAIHADRPAAAKASEAAPVAAAPALAQTPAETPVSPVKTAAAEAQFVNSLLKECRVLTRPNGDSELQLRLDPPDLGGVMVRLTLRNDQLTARIEVDTPAAREMLEGLTARVREALAADGMDLERFDVGLRRQMTTGYNDRGPREDRAGGDEDSPREREPRPASPRSARRLRSVLTDAGVRMDYVV